MRKTLTILLIVFANAVWGQTTHYVSTTGSDASGNGTSGNPWASLHKACQSVTTSGDIIHINAGTYTETLPAMVAVGVNIEGADSATTIIKSHYVADWNFNYPNDAAIAFVSGSEGTNGNQSLSGITLDGDNLTGTLGIVVKLRSNVIIHNIKIKDFYINGISYFGSSIDPNHKPTTYTSGNKLYNVTITNCTDTAETFVGGGNINMSGNQNLEIYNFVLADTSRGEGANGDNIVGNKYGIGVHIHDGVSYKPSSQNAGWNFHFEMPSEAGGAEINNVSFYGGDCALDIGDNIEDAFPLQHYNTAYPFKYSVHDNYFKDTHPEFTGSHGKYTITIEGTYVRNVLVYKNKFENVVCPVSISDGSNNAVDQAGIYIYSNQSINTGVNTNSSYEALLYINKAKSGSTLRDVFVINNTIFPNPITNTSAVNITNNGGCTMRNIVLANNIFLNGKNGYWLFVDNTGSTMDSLIIRNNDLYNNPNSNLPTFTGNPVTNYIYSGNITGNPLLTSSTNFTLKAGSPAIGAAYPYGYGSDIGAIQTTVIAPPTISISGSQTINVSNTSVSAAGTATSGQTITGYSWTKTSGTGSITSPSSASTALTGLSGVSTFQCTVTQSDGQTASAAVTITVNVAPTANAGTDQTITLPTSTVNLSGSGTDTDGTIASYSWSKVSGGSYSISNANVANPTLSSLVAGTYVFKLTVTDNNGGTGTDNVTITVNPANIPPVANAGNDVTITPPTSSATLSGSGTDSDGTIVSYAWTQVSGGSYTIDNAAITNPTISGLSTGTYVFRLTVTDNQGATGTDDVQIIVSSAAAPTVSLSGDQTITVGNTSVSAVAGWASGFSGTYLWTKISGPGATTFGTPTGASTTVINLQTGTYVIQCKVIQSDGQSATAQLTLHVTIPIVISSGQTLTVRTKTIYINN